MDPQVNEVLRGKRLKLFQQMCADAGVADGTLFDELTAGFRLTGPMQALWTVSQEDQTCDYHGTATQGILCLV